MALKLFYFDIQGRGEGIRLLCKYAGLALDDVRLTREEFAAKKVDGTLRFGQLPALEVQRNGKPFVLTQSASIMRYIAKTSGNSSLYPVDDHVTAALIDSIIEQENDSTVGLGVTIYQERFGFGILNNNEALVQAVRKSLNDEILPRHLAFFEALLKDSPSGWVAGGAAPSIADFVLATRMVWVTDGTKQGISATILEGYPLLSALIDKFLALPQIVEYYAQPGMQPLR